MKRRFVAPILMLVLCLLAASALFAAAKKPVAPPAQKSPDDRVWVVRPDGEQSCGIKEGQTVEEVAAELKKSGVTVLESRKGNDGQMHIQMCGAATGSLNAYLIPKAQLEKVKSLGFKEAPPEFPKN